jgi:ammonium transporter
MDFGDPQSALTPTGLLLMALAAVLVLTAQAGFLALHAGLMRPKNTANVAAAKLVDASAAALLTFVCGFGLMFGESIGGWLGGSGFFLGGSFAGAAQATTLSAFVLHALLCATVVTVVSGALGERMSFRAGVALAAFVAGIVYPLFGHWAWASSGKSAAGWLARSGFVDVAGATVVHSLAGWVALAGLLVVGNRSGRYARSGKPLPVTGSSAPLAILGALLVLVGWLGAVSGVSAAELDSVPQVVLATLLAGVAGTITGLVGSRRKSGFFELEPALRGLIAGLAAISAAPAAFGPAEAFAVGAVAGGVMLAVSGLLVRLRIDDAVGAVPAHLGGGVSGAALVALLGDPGRLGSALHPLAQLGVQLVGAVVCAAWGFGLTFLFLKGLGLVARLRVAPDEEFVGLNVSEHQASTELMDLMDALEETARHETPYVRGEPFAEVAQIAVRPDGHVARATPAASAIFGFSEGEWRRVAVTSLFSPEPAGFAALRAELDVRPDGRPRELRGIRRTGEEFPMEVQLVAADGDEPETLAIKDITARKENEEGLLRLTDQIRRRLERELEETRVLPGGGASADVELPGGDVSLALPPQRAGSSDWFGWFHDQETRAVTVYGGEVVAEVRGAAALLGSVLTGGGYEADYTHGLYLGDARYSPERQVRNLAEVFNRIVLAEGRGELTMSMSFAHVDLGSGTLIFVNAGRRTRALLKTGRVVKELGGGGGKLGVAADLELDVVQLALGPGDVLLLLGDGLCDTVTPDGSILRVAELKKTLLARSSASEICDEVVARARAVWKDPQGQSHPVLVFRWRPMGA